MTTQTLAMLTATAATAAGLKGSSCTSLLLGRLTYIECGNQWPLSCTFATMSHSG